MPMQQFKMVHLDVGCILHDYVHKDYNHGGLITNVFVIATFKPSSVFVIATFKPSSVFVIATFKSSSGRNHNSTLTISDGVACVF